MVAALSCPATATDTMGQVLERLQVAETRQLNYTETREMQFFAAPWQSSGQMYLSPGRIIIDQHKPKHSIISITENKLLYVEPKHDIRHIKKLAKPFAVPGIGQFLSILYGDPATEDLQRKFHTTFSTTQARWRLTLLPRVASTINRMEISGLTNQGADFIDLEFSDGDKTDWEFTLIATGAQAARKMNSVLATSLERP